ncbi:hypothetical protein F4782DRAFT_411695 [Xylaria castorea]|nr:hypothetical protein F4782DRAFT_411695 [Xylaria castorea]
MIGQITSPAVSTRYCNSARRQGAMGDPCLPCCLPLPRTSPSRFGPQLHQRAHPMHHGARRETVCRALPTIAHGIHDRGSLLTNGCAIPWPAVIAAGPRPMYRYHSSMSKVLHRHPP